MTDAIHPAAIVLHLFTNGHAIASATDVIDAAGLLLAERGTVRQLRDDAMVCVSITDAPPAAECVCRTFTGARLANGHLDLCHYAARWRMAAEWASDGRGVLRGAVVS